MVWLFKQGLGAHLLFSFHSPFIQKISFLVVRVLFVAMVLLPQFLLCWDKSLKIGFYQHVGAAGGLLFDLDGSGSFAIEG